MTDAPDPAASHTAPAVVVMGVSGCGKSTVGRLLAVRLGVAYVEGDDFHGEANRAKMARGEPLDDADRAGWLEHLAAALRARPAGAVLTCSALKKSYRDVLRAGRDGLAFVYLELDEAEALRRVGARHGHFFGPMLVSSQFATLEPPTAELRVLRVDARRPAEELSELASRWLLDLRT